MMFRGKVTDIFFDLDHTLWDFEKNSALTFELIFEKHGLPIDLEHFLEHYVPINLRFWKLYREDKINKPELRYQRLRQSFDLINVTIDDKTINQLSEDYITYLSSFKHTLPGATEILDYLKKTYRLHIITNGFTEIQEKKMMVSNIRQYFDVVVDSEMAGVKKPNPNIFHTALNLAGVRPEKALMIGDNLEADILGAQNVGLNTIHLTTGEKQNQKFSPSIVHLNEIKSLL